MFEEKIKDYTLQEKIKCLFDRQMDEWYLANENYKALENVKKRVIIFEPYPKIIVQYNPKRIRSSAAMVDKKSIEKRKCFLCRENLPKQQKGVYFENYMILVNPFPIFKNHLTIPSMKHINQHIDGRIKDMLKLARSLPDYVIFYNGPRCGASAPDHFHFQAGSKGELPLEDEFMRNKTLVLQNENINVYSIRNYLRNNIILEGDDMANIKHWFKKIFEYLCKEDPSKDEPMLNILCFFEECKWRVFIFPRMKHRPKQFYAKGEDNIVLSPASVDLAGVLITPKEKDFYKLNNEIIADIFSQVTLQDEKFRSMERSIFKT